MSIRIDVTKPISDEEREFLETRGPRGRYLLQMNDNHLAASEYYRSKAQESDEDDEDIDSMTDEERAATLAEAEAWIAKAKVQELKDKLTERDLSTEGNQTELRARLTEAVQAEYAPRGEG